MKKDTQSLSQTLHELIKIFDEADIINSHTEAIELVRNHPALPEADKALLLEKLSGSTLMLIGFMSLCVKAG